MANPRRNSSSSQSSSDSQSLNLSSYSSLLIHFFKKPHALPFLLSIFLILTWLSLRLQHSSSSIQSSHHITPSLHNDDDAMANLVRFASGFPSPIAKDNRGWLLDPISLALSSAISGGAVSCASIHLGQIGPCPLRGSYRHNTCNETFVIWGAQTRFRVTSLTSVPCHFGVKTVS